MTYPKIGETADIANENKMIHVMMIKTTSYALVAEADEEDGHLYAYLKEDDREGWNDLSADAMLNHGWVPLEFNEPKPFAEALEIAREYREKTQILEAHAMEYKEYVHKLRKITSMK